SGTVPPDRASNAGGHRDGPPDGTGRRNVRRDRGGCRVAGGPRRSSRRRLRMEPCGGRRRELGTLRIYLLPRHLGRSRYGPACDRNPFLAGLNLLGMPVALTDPVFGDLMAGGAGADAWSYDACATGFAWSSALPTDGTTFRLPTGRGFWLNGTASDFAVALGLLA